MNTALIDDLLCWVHNETCTDVECFSPSDWEYWGTKTLNALREFAQRDLHETDAATSDRKDTAHDEISTLQDAFHCIAQRFARGDRSAFAAWLKEAEQFRRNDWLQGATSEAAAHLEQLHGVATMAEILYASNAQTNPLTAFCHDAEIGQWLASMLHLVSAGAFRSDKPGVIAHLNSLSFIVFCMDAGKPGSVFDAEGRRHA